MYVILDETDLVIFFIKGSSSTTLFPISPVRGPSMGSEITNLGTQLRAQSTTMQQVRKDVSEVKIGYTNNKKRLTDQEKKIIQQGLVIGELEKKLSDMNQKFIDLTAELQKLKEVKEGGENSKSISHLHKEEYSARKGNSEQKPDGESKGRVTRNKGLKRKNGGQYESRVKKSKS